MFFERHRGIGTRPPSRCCFAVSISVRDSRPFLDPFCLALKIALLHANLSCIALHILDLISAYPSPLKRFVCAPSPFVLSPTFFVGRGLEEFVRSWTYYKLCKGCVPQSTNPVNKQAFLCSGLQRTNNSKKTALDPAHEGRCYCWVSIVKSNVRMTYVTVHLRCIKAEIDFALLLMFMCKW